MEENSSKEIPVAVAEIPPLEENMVVECDPVPAPDDENEAILAEYKKEMMQNGLVDSDVDYLLSEYQDLENVKTVKMHCTSCDKHIGSAPNAIQDRYEHPLLKVLICAKCFQFYTSGEFEKDEDGSELYCRWCGEGGQVFCCSKCPFVFCKKCITRNLGKSMAKIIGSSDNWVCFSCDPSSISRPRASYWAVQKYSSIMIQKAEETGNKSELFVDGNTCCFGVKRRHSTLEQILRKKPKPDTMSLYQHVLDSTNKNRKMKRKNEPKRQTWHELISEQPEDEVICTPDILPLEPLDDESPPHSPVTIEPPPPLYPVIHHHNIPSNVPLQIPVLQPMPPLMMRAPVPKITVAELQNQLQKKYTQIVLTPRPRSQQNSSNQTIMLQKTQPLLPKNTPPNNGNYKFVINSKSKTFVPNVINANFVLTSTASKSDAQASVATTSKANTTTSKANTTTTSKVNTTTTPKANTTTSKANSTLSNGGADWFEKAVLDCAELTEFLSARISSLSEMHKKNTTDRSVAELYKSFQSYMDIVLGKIGNIKRTMVSNYEKEMENRMREKIVNPFAIKTAKRARKAKSDSDYIPTSSDDSNSTDSFIIINEKPHLVSTSNSPDSFAVVNNYNKTPLITTNNMKPEEVLFDMDVTNASDEERNTPAAEHKDNSDSDDDVQEVEYTRNTEVIQIEDSDDDVIEEKEFDALAFCDTEINDKETDESVTTENKETDESVITENKETDESVTTENKETVEPVTTENKEKDEPVTTENKEVDESVTTDEKNSENKDIDGKMIEKEIDETPSTDEKMIEKEIGETLSTDEKMIEKEIDETLSTDEKMIEKEIDETPSTDEKMIENSEIDETPSTNEKMIENSDIDETPPTEEKIIEKEIDETPSTDEKMIKNTEIDETPTTDEKMIVDEEIDEIPTVNEKKEINESPTIAIKILRNIKDKFNIENMTIQELIKYLSAVIIANKSTNESANQTISEKERRDIVKKIISRIESLSEERFAKAKKSRRTIRRHKKECEKIENETNIEYSTKQDCSENRENTENDDFSQITTQISTNTDDDLKYLGDIEDILAGNVVLRPTNSTSGFVDEFSKFVTNKSDEPSEEMSDGLIDTLEPSEDMSDGLIDTLEEPSEDMSDGLIDTLEPSEDMSDDLKGTLETSEAMPDCLKDTLESSEEMSDTLIIARELDIIPEYVDDICNNRDNGSLSLPPDCITGISASDLNMLVKESEENVNNGNEVLKKENESDIILNSEILALQQLAENCVSSVDVHKSSAECKG